jgi:uncharacterized Ntn-hydrolase superfamily protein
MTWSIIAREAATGRFGIAVATKFFAVGARVPFVAAGVGAIATQALINPFYGVDGVRLLREGLAPDAIVSVLTDADDGRAHRQVHVMDREGRVAAFTGSECVGWCGAQAGETYSLAGNMLAGPAVLAATAAAYESGNGLPFARRLIAAMQAGEAAGGDKRGRQSAALVIYGDEDWSDLDLRVDDHADPLAELARLERVSRERFVPFSKFLPNRHNRSGATDRAIIEAGIADALAAEQAADAGAGKP